MVPVSTLLWSEVGIFLLGPGCGDVSWCWGGGQFAEVTPSRDLLQDLVAVGAAVL